VKHHLANARSKVGAATTAQLVWILAPRLPEPEGMAPRGGRSAQDHVYLSAPAARPGPVAGSDDGRSQRPRLAKMPGR